MDTYKEQKKFRNLFSGGHNSDEATMGRREAIEEERNYNLFGEDILKFTQENENNLENIFQHFKRVFGSNFIYDNSYEKYLENKESINEELINAALINYEDSFSYRLSSVLNPEQSKFNIVYNKILTYIFSNYFKNNNNICDIDPFIKKITKGIIEVFFRHSEVGVFPYKPKPFVWFSNFFKEDILKLIPDGNWKKIRKCLDLPEKIDSIIRGWRSENKYSWYPSRKISKGWKSLGFGGKKTRKGKKVRKTRKNRKYRK